MKVLLAGWHTIGERHATIGDKLTVNLIASYFKKHEIPYKIATELRDITKNDLKIWITGPVDPSYPPQKEILDIGVENWVLFNVSLLEDKDSINKRINTEFSRDRFGKGINADLAILSKKEHPTMKQALLCLRGYQPEYRQSKEVHNSCKSLTLKTLCKLKYFPLFMDTSIPEGFTFEQAHTAFINNINKSDLYITSRLHGIIFGLHSGSLPIIIDEVTCGGKITAICEKFRIPYLTYKQKTFEQDLFKHIETVNNYNEKPYKFIDKLINTMELSAKKNLDKLIEEIDKMKTSKNE